MGAISAAALLIEQGVHPKVIADRLEHASITTTMDTYGHLFPNQEAAIAEMLEQTFQAAAQKRGATTVTQIGGQP